jgi:hypothetical protein
MSEMEVFSPVDYSIQENIFLLENLGKPTIVALQSVPKGVNPRAVRPVFDRVNELDQLEAHQGTKWAGVDAVKEKISAYLRENAKWKADATRFRGARSEQIKRRFPSLYAWDSRGRGHRGGIGSDQGRVRTYFDAAGKRVPFDLPLTGEVEDNWVPPGAEVAPTTERGVGLTVDSEKNRIECFCGHTEGFKADSRASYNAARARMSKHLRKATDRVDDHKEVHLAEFS